MHLDVIENTPASQRSAGVTPPNVNLRIRPQAGNEAVQSEGIHSGFETTGKCHEKYKTGVRLAQSKRLMLSNLFLKTKKNFTCNII